MGQLTAVNLSKEDRERESQFMKQFSLAAKILGAIQQKEGINFRTLHLRSGIQKQGALARILCDMQELSLIERLDEKITEESPRRGLKPRVETHYRLTAFGRSLLQDISDRTIYRE